MKIIDNVDAILRYSDKTILCHGKVTSRHDNNIYRLPMIKRAISILLLLGTSMSAMASPELISPSEIQYGQFELIETVEINGDINDSLLRLVDSSLKNKNNDFYVIQDISEDTRADTLTVVINLYNQRPSFILEQAPA
ncbi:hypothetical protein MD588_07270 [Photobacterium sp. SDRW27]|uniref:hypothetical protein n=1 Tax=Photobacterium obscurum TaxID=2829490 RepID=UPI00224341A0|nr:hypothetical protein [Photobacterium obscurum]MCW8328606.1 hypothetical protein [Photobacterium obscurum]